MRRKVFRTTPRAPVGGLVLVFTLAAIAILTVVLIVTSLADPLEQTWDDEIHPRIAQDINPNSSIVEINLVAQLSTHKYSDTRNATAVYSYNGFIPGPTIEANVGDTLIVNFKNLLPDPTTIHWHGVEVPVTMDGSNIDQLDVLPNGSYRYEFKILNPGLFWYHSHRNTDVQVTKGLHGALLFKDPAQESNLNLPRKESLLILTDVLLDESDQIITDLPSDPVERSQVLLNGREGNVLLVNGRELPTATISRGVPHRFRVVNVANSRFMRISIPSHKMWRIGGDGGLLEHPLEIQPVTTTPEPDNSKGILLTPGERADFIVIPDSLTENQVEFTWYDWARGRHANQLVAGPVIEIDDDPMDGLYPPITMMNIGLIGSTVTDPSYSPTENLTTITPIVYAGEPVIMPRFGHGPPNPATGDITFFAWAIPPPPMLIPKPFPIFDPSLAPDVSPNDVRVIAVVNLSGGDHNFHIHGFQFQLINYQFVDMNTPANNEIIPAQYLEFKDTIFVPKRTGAGGGNSLTITRLAIKFSDTGREGQIFASGKVQTNTTSGGWVFHCHILEHVNRGMMGFIEVKP